MPVFMSRQRTGLDTMFMAEDLIQKQQTSRLRRVQSGARTTVVFRCKSRSSSVSTLPSDPYNYEKDEAIRLIGEFIRKHPKLDAIFFATNYLGITGLESIKQAGMKIPDDIAVICFDDHDIFRLYPPGITSIKQPITEIARTSVHMLMQQLGKFKMKSKKKQLKLAAHLIERGST